jgi:hypothetical protein
MNNKCTTHWEHPFCHLFVNKATISFIIPILYSVPGIIVLTFQKDGPTTTEVQKPFCLQMDDNDGRPIT